MMSTRFAALAAAFALVATSLYAQPRDPRRTRVGSAAISGMVTSDDTDQRPVRRARVTCTSTDFSATAITDDRGRFVFPGLNAGRYTVTATKDAWITTAYGAKRLLRPGSAIPLAEGQRVAIVLKMLRGSVITGVVLDHDNQPASNTTVSALGYTMQNGERRLAASASGMTDDRGVYRIYGLAPGQYFVGAAAPTAAFNAPSSELRLISARGTERTVAFAPTYFPGTPIASQASPVSLGPGEERDGVDFALQLVPTARVDGAVVAADGSPAPPGTQVNLVSSLQTVPGTTLGGFRATSIGADGAFSFVDVSPGTYTVLARGPAPAGSGSQVSWASTDIAVDGESITGLSLGLQAGMSLAGEVRWDRTRLQVPADLKSIRLTLQPVQARGAVTLAPSGVILDQAGHFEITGIVPGRYRLVATLPGLGRPGNWHLRSAVINGQDTLDLPIEIRPNESIRDVVVTLTDHPAQITGGVQNAAGGAPNEFTVVLFPVEQALWLPQARRIQAVRPSADGVFAFQGLPAGDYLLAAIDDIEPGEWFDPSMLQRLVQTAMRISLADGEHKAQDVRLGGGT